MSFFFFFFRYLRGQNGQSYPLEVISGFNSKDYVQRCSHMYHCIAELKLSAKAVLFWICDINIDLDIQKVLILLDLYTLKSYITVSIYAMKTLNLARYNHYMLKRKSYISLDDVEPTCFLQVVSCSYFQTTRNMRSFLMWCQNFVYAYWPLNRKVVTG